MSSSISNQNQNQQKSKGRGPNFTAEENKTLCRSWLTVSSNARVGVYQTSEAFWEKVKNEFDDITENRFSRNSAALMNRFGDITKEVSKFCGCYEEIIRQNPSGHNEESLVSVLKLT